MSKVLVVGGAGYVGSACVAHLLDRGHEVHVLDDLSTGHESLVLVPPARFTRARAGNSAVVGPLLERGRFDCVMHFAARSLVEESVRLPELYRENNVEQTRALLELMLMSGTRHFVFSSTCAVFGVPPADRIDERTPFAPVNPYGDTKLAVEKMLEELAKTRGLRAIALRYFNAAGAEPGLRTGEWHDPESHLIPRILRAARGEGALEVFGTDYPTPDGTCVRDYVHVSDLARAHEAAMERLVGGSAGLFEAFNLGSESGYSVREIADACERVTGAKLVRRVRPRRAGDPPRLVADSALARRELGFSPQHGLDSILSTAWAWEKKRGAGLRRAVFLDRDGTLNEDPGYLSDPAQLKLYAGVGEALARLKAAGFLLVVVSNQSGVARGFIPPDALPKIHRRLDELLAPWNLVIDHYELCIHRPEDACECRKPKPKLLVDAARVLGVDLAQSFMIGDKDTDAGAGRAAGCRASVLVRTGHGGKAGPEAADFIGDTLGDAVEWVVRRASGT
jgi:UDP-glucose 4-epimerase